MFKVCAAASPAQHAAPETLLQCNRQTLHSNTFALPELSVLYCIIMTFYSCISDKVPSALQNTSSVTHTRDDVTHALSPNPRMILQHAVCI